MESELANEAQGLDNHNHSINREACIFP